MARIYENLCYSCKEKLGKLYRLRDEEQKHEKIAVCKLCGSCGYYDRISYDPLIDSLKGRGQN